MHVLNSTVPVSITKFFLASNVLPPLQADSNMSDAVQETEAFTHLRSGKQESNQVRNVRASAADR